MSPENSAGSPGTPVAMLENGLRTMIREPMTEEKIMALTDLGFCSYSQALAHQFLSQEAREHLRKTIQEATSLGKARGLLDRFARIGAPDPSVLLGGPASVPGGLADPLVASLRSNLPAYPGGLETGGQIDPGVIDAFLRGERAEGLSSLSARHAYAIAKLGYNDLEAGRYPEAETIFRGLTARFSRDGYFRTCLGATCQRQARHIEALEHYSLALALDENDMDARGNRGEVNLLVGKLVEAASDFRLVVDRFGRDSQNAIVRRARALSTIVALALVAKLGGEERFGHKPIEDRVRSYPGG